MCALVHAHAPGVCGHDSNPLPEMTSAVPGKNKIGAQRSGSDFEKEEGDCGYGVFAALTQTAETEWSRLLLTLAPMRGFEPPTYRLGGGRSILLSYMGVCKSTLAF